MKEIGFWDYSCPGNGSLELYTEQDYDVLLDDMVEGGFNSFCLCMKWLSTGYKSKLPWLDQSTDKCSAIATDNKVLLHALKGARKRGIKTWLLVVATIYQAKEFNMPGASNYWGENTAIYDLDHPGLLERIDALFAEIVEIFGELGDGIVVELEFCDGEAPHRIPIYEAWAQANNRPDYKTIKNIRLEPRGYPYHHWRDFTTHQRIGVLKRIESVVRAGGFKGELSSLIELDNAPMGLLGNVNLEMLRDALPQWPVVTYDSIYDRRRHRLATMDFCIQTPHDLGLQAYYLTRGVMTFALQPGMAPTTLQEQWRMSLEDAAVHKPEIFWFMGADARLDGWVCNNIKLPEWGFADGRTARKYLMSEAKRMGLSCRVR